MRFRLAIFDFDGTLADSFPWFTGVLNQVAARYRFRPVAEDEVEMLRRLDARQILAHLAVPGWKVPLIAAHMRGLQARAEIRPFAGLPALLGELADNGLRLALVSSNQEANVRRILGPELFGRFEQVECGAALFGKAARLRRVVARAGLPKPQIAAIGDEIRDIEAAHAAGLVSVAVGWGYTDAGALAARRPDHLARTVGELREILAGCAG
ncbi:MAG: hypothetical protein RLZZ501_1947 [Pseudomonadota bacterium]|jgi:phosphoglycolate phosphatase